MDLKRITVFVRVVESGSFTGAAAALGIRKSSVSRSVAALEAALGIRLLQRTTRTLSLTDAGRAYYDRARDVLAGLEEAEHAAEARSVEPRGLVRLTAPVDLAGNIALVTSTFLQAHPAVRIETFVTARYVELVKERFDLAVRAGVLTDSSLLARKIGETELGLFASPAYLDTAGRPQRLADVAAHECVLYGAGGPTTTWRLSGPSGEEEVKVRGRADTNEFAFLAAMLLAGFGIGLGPVNVFVPRVESGELERVLPAYARHSGPIHLVWPSRRLEPVAVALLREALAEGLLRSLRVARISP
jgi:DNA-binding transcriptional LysR family regulator